MLHNTLDNMRGALRFFLAHLNALRDDQWDWSPSPACRSIRQILLHMSETFDDREALARELSHAVPDVPRVQRLFQEEALGDYDRLGQKYRDTPPDAEIAVPGGDFFLGTATVALGTLLMRRAWEECYHTGQIAYIRLATDPDWDLDREVYGSDHHSS